MTTQEKIKKIEQKVDKEYLLDQYENVYYSLLDIQYQNKWLKTKDGKDAVGSDNAEVHIQKNKQSANELINRLAFLKKQIQG